MQVEGGFLTDSAFNGLFADLTGIRGNAVTLGAGLDKGDGERKVLGLIGQIALSVLGNGQTAVFAVGIGEGKFVLLAIVSLHDNALNRQSTIAAIGNVDCHGVAGAVVCDALCTASGFRYSVLISACMGKGAEGDLSILVHGVNALSGKGSLVICTAVRNAADGHSRCICGDSSYCERKLCIRNIQTFGHHKVLGDLLLSERCHIGGIICKSRQAKACSQQTGQGQSRDHFLHQFHYLPSLFFHHFVWLKPSAAQKSNNSTFDLFFCHKAVDAAVLRIGAVVGQHKIFARFQRLRVADALFVGQGVGGDVGFLLAVSVEE